MVGKIIKLKPKKEIRKPGSIKKEGKVINADFKKLKINLEKNLKALPKDKNLDYELFNKCRELIATKLVGHGNYSMDINLRYKKIVYGLKKYRKEIKKLKNSKEIIDLNMNRIIKVFYNELKKQITLLNSIMLLLISMKHFILMLKANFIQYLEE